ncbi:hypothetical protein RRF57_000498 [Xylaria bambusicola]|uniref:Uncharacterized protein n=1 Tax=Xylaria bambusicola TaxID=326684 RepID=A0AAN7YZQ4_9PEZI
MHHSLSDVRAWRHTRVIGAEEGSRGLDLVALVQLALQVGNGDHNSEVLPYVLLTQLERVANNARRSSSSARNFGLQSFLSLQSVEVLGEATAARTKVLALDDEHSERV